MGCVLKTITEIILYSGVFIFSGCVRELRVSPWLNNEQKNQRHTAHTFTAVGACLSLNNTKGGFKGPSADVGFRKVMP